MNGARVVTYACPRVGNEDRVDATVEHIRIVNNSDAVPGVPAAVSPNKLNPPSRAFIIILEPK